MRRLIAIVLAVAALQFGGYHYLRTMALDTSGATISQTISIVRARHQMAKIADAEREEFVTHSECFSIDDLAGMGKLENTDAQRAGYTFSISCSDELKFNVVGTHAAASADPHFRWPVLAIDQDLKFRKLDN